MRPDKRLVLANLLENDDITGLNKAGIRFQSCELDPPFEGLGIIVDEKDFQMVCRICNINQSKYNLIQTNDPSIFVVEFVLDLDPNSPRADLYRGYINLVKGRLAADAKEIEIKVAEVHERINTLISEIHTQARVLHDETAKVNHLRLYAIEMTNQLLATFGQLYEHPVVDTITVQNGTLMVRTMPIIISTADAGTINLGSYQIDISPNTVTPRFSATSDKQIRRINGRNFIHPLISTDNTTLPLRLRPTFAQLMGEWNLSQVVLLALNLLSTVDLASTPTLLKWRKDER